MLEKQQLKQDELEKVTGGFGESDLWCYSFEYDFSPDFSNPKISFNWGFASKEEATAAMNAEKENLAAIQKCRDGLGIIYVRKEIVDLLCRLKSGNPPSFIYD